MKNPLQYSIGSRIRDRYVIDYLQPRPGDQIVDVGCGIGYFCERLTQFGARMTGVDVDSSVIASARGLYPGLDFALGSASEIPFKDAAFDKVLCTEVLEHVEDDSRALAELCRVVRPGGVVLITVPCSQGIFGSRIKDIGHSHDDGFEKHFREGYTREALVSLCEVQGLQLMDYCFTMTFFVELYMGLTKTAFLLLNKGALKGQADIQAVKTDGFLMKVNSLLLELFLKIGYVEDRMLSYMIKGHALILQCRKA